MESFQTNPISLGHLLSAIHERKLALPDFQRVFVWDAGATEELIESIAQSFPAGSLLFLPFRQNEFSPREIAGAPELNGVTPNELILDGQQRLTSLYQAFYGVGDHRYFIDLRKLMEGEDIQEAVFYRHRNRCGRFTTLEQQAEQLVLPLGVLFGEPGGFHAWRDEVLDRRSERDEARTLLREQLRTAHEGSIKQVESYRFPVVSLDQSTSLEAVCSIFETLNRTGIRLSVFELLAARFYAKGLDLRGKWQETREEGAIISDFGVDEYYVLQSIALRARNSVKRGDVLRLTVDDIQTHWEPVTRGYRKALEMLRDECGVKLAKWLPYGYLLVPMGALWSTAIEIAGPVSGANRERLKQWFWCSAFSGTYDRAANTQAAKDHAELGRWFRGEDAPEVIREFDFDSSRLREITPRQQSIYKAAVALVLSNPALDFHHASQLTRDAMDAKGVDDHHVFPQAYLNPKDEPRRQPQELVDSVLNRTLIDADTNRRIGKRAPSDYLAEIRGELDQVSPSAFESVLISHVLPTGTASPLFGDRFEDFVAWRQDALAERVRRVTHSVASQ